MPLTVTFSADRNKIHSGPGFPFINILRPNYLLHPLFTGNPPTYSDPADPAAPATTHAQNVGDTVQDTNGNVQLCTTAGTTGGSAPTWNTVIGGTTTDGTVTWTNTGPTWKWTASTPILADQQIRDGNNNIQLCLTPGTTGSGPAPTWSTVFLGLTTDGTVTWINLGPTLASGAVTGDVAFDIAATMLEIDADQYTSPLDKRITKEVAKLTGTLRELNLSVAKISVPNAAYTSGTDVKFATGAQAYEELGFGGQYVVAAPCVAVVSPRPNYSNPNRYVMGWLNKAIAAQGFNIPMSLRKVSDYKVDWEGLAVTWQPAGYQIGRMLRMT